MSRLPTVLREIALKLIANKCCLRSLGWMENRPERGENELRRFNDK
jgi:hypothetical protein